MVVVNPDGTRAYVSDRPGGAVTVLDLSGGHPTFLRNISTSYGRYGYPDGLAYVTFTGGVATTTSTDWPTRRAAVGGRLRGPAPP
jgi:DNA-binding beta-propeller fold protein YncE